MVCDKFYGCFGGVWKAAGYGHGRWKEAGCAPYDPRRWVQLSCRRVQVPADGRNFPSKGVGHRIVVSAQGRRNAVQLPCRWDNCSADGCSSPSKGVDRRAVGSGAGPVAAPRVLPSMGAVQLPKGADLHRWAQIPRRRALTAGRRYPAQGRRTTTQAGRARAREPAQSGCDGGLRAGPRRKRPVVPKRPRRIARMRRMVAPAMEFAARMPRMGHERAKRRRQGNREEGWNCAAGPARPRLWYDGQKRRPAAAAGRRLARKPRYMSLRYAAP